MYNELRPGLMAAKQQTGKKTTVQNSLAPILHPQLITMKWAKAESR